MNEATDFLLSRWLAVALLAGAAVLGLVLLWLHRRRRWSPCVALSACALALVGCGGLTFPSARVAGWTTCAALVVLAVLFAVVVLTGRWWAPLGYFAGGCLLLGLGGWVTPGLGRLLIRSGAFLLSLEPLQPAWLLL